VSILAVLMLRGPQTVNELKTRTERLARIDDVPAVLERLDAKELVHNIGKQPGQSAERWKHLLDEGPAEPAEEAEPESIEKRIARLEEKIAELERALAERGLLD
jgi:hypothetical protein